MYWECKDGFHPSVLVLGWVAFYTHLHGHRHRPPRKTRSGLLWVPMYAPRSSPGLDLDPSLGPWLCGLPCFGQVWSFQTTTQRQAIPTSQQLLILRALCWVQRLTFHISEGPTRDLRAGKNG